MKANTSEAMEPGTHVSIKLNNRSEHLLGSVKYVDTLGIQVSLNDTEHHGAAVNQDAFFPWASITYITTDVTVRNQSYGAGDTWWTTFSAFGWMKKNLNGYGESFELNQIPKEHEWVQDEAWQLLAKFAENNEILGGKR